MPYVIDNVIDLAREHPIKKFLVLIDPDPDGNSQRVTILQHNNEEPKIYEGFEGEILYSMIYEDYVFIQTLKFTYVIRGDSIEKIKQKPTVKDLCYVCTFYLNPNIITFACPQETDDGTNIKFFKYNSDIDSIGAAIHSRKVHAKNLSYEISKDGTFIARQYSTNGKLFYFRFFNNRSIEYQTIENINSGFYEKYDRTYYRLDPRDRFYHDMSFYEARYTLKDLQSNYSYGVYIGKDYLKRGNMIEMYKSVGQVCVMEYWIIIDNKIYQSNSPELFRNYFIEVLDSDGAMVVSNLAECYGIFVFFNKNKKQKGSIYPKNVLIDFPLALQINEQ